ncbi:MAG: prepilin-type N-terminal cleavage/methylation domain-containing protein [Planctomycetes bacterium]|nr:prepilin-type N-terminal cleavage/methylation domain-containing protein [Planctomycetota bacterium]MBL7145911.1 prepilin-type N-terminal cleavage/methylation domain-containing protein [Phycisphaerae bacterium]
MKRKRQKGFTLIELVIAIFTGTIVIVAAGMILFFGQRTWNSTWDRTNLQRDASYAMSRMTRDIKAGVSAQVESNGDGLKIFNGGDWVRFFTTSGAAMLTLKSETGGTSYQTALYGTVLEDNVEALKFNVTGNTVTIDLKMKDYNLETHFASTVMMRNYGQ